MSNLFSGISLKTRGRIPKNFDFGVSHCSGLVRDSELSPQPRGCKSQQLSTADSITAPLFDENDQSLGVWMAEIVSDQDHNLFSDDSDTHSDNIITSLTQLSDQSDLAELPPNAHIDSYSKLEEKKPVPESISTLEFPLTTGDCTTNAVNRQLQNQESSCNQRWPFVPFDQESPYARCKPMAPSQSPNRERCKPMGPPNFSSTSPRQP